MSILWNEMLQNNSELQVFGRNEKHDRKFFMKMPYFSEWARLKRPQNGLQKWKRKMLMGVFESVGLFRV